MKQVAVEAGKGDLGAPDKLLVAEKRVDLMVEKIQQLGVSSIGLQTELGCQHRRVPRRKKYTAFFGVPFFTFTKDLASVVKLIDY